MHPNAEIDFRTNQCINLFRMLVELQPKDTTGSEGGGGDVKTEKIKEFMVRVTDETALDQNKLNIDDIAGKMSEERGPYQNVFLQECEVMNVLINEIVGSLKEIELSFKGELTMTEKME
jgi:dynein heavy chain